MDIKGAARKCRRFDYRVGMPAGVADRRANPLSTSEVHRAWERQDDPRRQFQEEPSKLARAYRVLTVLVPLRWLHT